ncbi:MAG TPA: response regulator transcription factor [Gemmatimonadaceae bacterium]
MSLPIAESIGVAIVEDDRHFRDALQSLVERQDGMHCVFAVASCEAALEAFDGDAAPRVVIMDLGLPGASGVEGITMLRARCESTEFIVLTIHEDHERVFDSFCAGATGYLLKSASSDEIAHGIRTVAAGGASLDTFIARRVLQTFRAPSPPRSSVALTKREHEVLRELADGHSLKEIAANLGLSRHTIDSHVRGIYAKLQTRSRAGAVAKALRNRIL